MHTDIRSPDGQDEIVVETGAATPAGRAREGTRFPCFDGLRALAALAVFAFHSSGLTYSNGDLHPSAAVISWLRSLGFFGVAVFFVISGFLLYRPFAAASLRQTPMPRWLPFWKRRLFRIFPAYWVALAVSVYALNQKTFASTDEAVTHFLLGQNYRGGFTGQGLGVAWTLVIEISFYLALPFLAVALDRSMKLFGGASNRARALLLGLAVMAAFSLLVRVWWLAGTPRPLARFGTWLPIEQFSMWLPAYLDWFAFGMAMAVGIEWLRAGGRIPRAIELLGRRSWLSWLLAIECYWVLTRIGLGGYVNASRFSATQTNLRWIFTGLAAAFFVLPAVFGPQDVGVVRRLLRNPVMVSLGIISYGIYLWHFPMWLVVLKWRDAAWLAGHGWVQIAVVLGMTIGAAALSYTLVERPLIMWSSGHRAPNFIRLRRPHSAGEHREADQVPRAPSTTAARVPVGAAIVAVLAAAIVLGSFHFSLLASATTDPYAWKGERSAVWDTFARSNPSELGTTSTGQPWIDLSGAWSTADGTARVQPQELPSFSIVRAEGAPLNSVRAVVTGSTDGVGIAFRCQDENNCWWIEAQPKYATWSVSKIVDGKISYVDNIGVVPTGPGTVIALHMRGDLVGFAVDGRFKGAVKDPDLVGATGVGLAFGQFRKTGGAWTQFEAS